MKCCTGLFCNRDNGHVLRTIRILIDDSPVNRVKPVPITFIVCILRFAFISCPAAERQAVANMICIAFFFCLRPGEYTGELSP